MSVQRVQLQPAYVLHHRPYRDTSRIVELFTRDFGRLTLFARGARNLKHGVSVASILQPFHRVLATYAVRAEAGNLSAAEFDGEYSELPNSRTLGGYYLNELLLRLLERHDAHADVFALYDGSVQRLKDVTAEESEVLRIFEKRLLEMLGYGLSLQCEAGNGDAVVSDAAYRYVPELGVMRVSGVAEGDLIFSGSSLLALNRESFSNAAERSDARRLLRAALDRCLAGRELHTREVLRELRKLKYSSVSSVSDQ